MWWMLDEGQTAFRILLVLEAVWVGLVFMLAATQSRARRHLSKPVRLPAEDRAPGRRAA
jgi:hypothetical protein